MTTAADLAGDLDAANEDALAFAGDCSLDEWVTIVPGEQWPVAVVLHHIAVGHELMLGWLDRLLLGEAISGSSGDIDEANALHAAEYSDAVVQDTIDLLRAKGAKAVAAIAALSEEELGRSGPFGPAEGRPMTVAQLSAVATRHVRGHLDSAMTAVGRA
jgi:hypothetical protein